MDSPKSMSSPPKVNRSNRHSSGKQENATKSNCHQINNLNSEDIIDPNCINYVKSRKKNQIYNFNLFIDFLFYVFILFFFFALSLGKIF
jgi:hypothetical protein